MLQHHNLKQRHKTRTSKGVSAVVKEAQTIALQQQVSSTFMCTKAVHAHTESLSDRP